MPDREKVISALECISSGAEKTCRDCEYSKREEWCVAECAKDALSLLKAQEPRVMTLEEAKKAEVCWLELCGYEPFATLEAGTWNPEEYGKSYRCWNHMPTEEQRKAVKWDGTNRKTLV